MTLHVQVPPTYPNERKYILSVILGEFLGVDFHVSTANRSRVTITSNTGGELTLDDTLFSTPGDRWLTPASLPRQPLDTLELCGLPIEAHTACSRLPVIYGRRLNNNAFVDIRHNLIQIGVDIFGSAFFMLTRYEELIKPERDEHGRFPAQASLAFQEGFLEQPIVNEYVEILWGAVKLLWPGVHRRSRRFRVLVSHDVDYPLLIRAESSWQTLKKAGGDLLKRQQAGLAAKRIFSRVQGQFGCLTGDLYNTFDWLMDTSETHGLRAAFYFIGGKTGGHVNGAYTLTEPWIQKLLCNIHYRGNEIGLHPGYDTFLDRCKIQREFAELKRVAGHLGIRQDIWGGRQHYLRWEVPATWQAWDDCGLDYDTTLGFAEHVGFRAGVCYEYPVFNLRSRLALNLVERPLTLMDGTLLGHPYMRLSAQAALERAMTLRGRIQRFAGDFSILWHNSYLVYSHHRELFRAILAGQ